MDLATALNVMDQGPFSITFCTLDRNRRKGGEIRTLKNMVRAGASHNLQRSRQFAIKPADGTGHNIPVHLRLLLRINGEPVL